MYSLTEVSAGLYLQSTHDLNHGNKMCTINLNVLFYCSFGVFPLCPHNPFFSSLCYSAAHNDDDRNTVLLSMIVYRYMMT